MPVVVFPLMPHRIHHDQVVDDLEGNDLDRTAEWVDRFTLATDIRVCFCDPQSQSQRGSNENTSGLLRQYLPKGIDISGHLNGQAERCGETTERTAEKVSQLPDAS